MPVIHGKPQGEFLIELFRILGPQGDQQLHAPSLDAGQADFALNADISVFYPVPAVLFQFLQGTLAQPPVADKQFPGQAHLAVPL